MLVLLFSITHLMPAVARRWLGGGGGGERVWPGATTPPLTLIGNTLMGI